ncbi:hypothetical protein JX266_003711 [Neoarthrinium moseri]|nr:hypothetical protein JX266_003711 [Neoarthrinium moseri]
MVAMTDSPAAAPATGHVPKTDSTTTSDVLPPTETTTATTNASAAGAEAPKLDTTAETAAPEAKPPTSQTEVTPTAPVAAPAPVESANSANGAGAASSATSTTVGGGGLSKDEATTLEDFQGDVQTNNNLPSEETLRKLEKYTVLDESGKSHTFKSLYTGPNVARRVLIIFVRHFFCGNCQEYLRTLSAAITPEALLSLPVPTSIAVIGCGNHKLIKSYLEETGCPFPVYADNTQHLYRELGMLRTLAAGARPAYMARKSMAQTVVSGITQALRQVKSGLVLQMGDQKQVGGEFLFEPASLSLDTPIATPQDERAAPAPLDLDDRANGHDSEKSEDKKITWCHRMRNTRDHVEIPELKDVLGLTGGDDDDGAAEGDARKAAPGTGAGRPSAEAGRHHKDQERWAKALRQRKGTGLSMASQMSRMSLDAKAASVAAGGKEEGGVVKEGVQTEKK